MFVCLTNDTTYLTGNEGQKFRAVLSENAPLQKLEWFQHRTIFIAAENAHAPYIRPRGGKRPFCFSFGEKTSPVLFD